ncbi:MAG: hypothetical protein ABIL22_05805, partial [candidate division WOR-3 bacterium]
MKLKRIIQFVASAITLGNYPAIWQGGIYQGPLKQGCVPILNCWGCPLSLFSCPIGGLQHFFNLHLIPFYIAGFFGAVGTVGVLGADGGGRGISKISTTSEYPFELYPPPKNILFV